MIMIPAIIALTVSVVHISDGSTSADRSHSRNLGADGTHSFPAMDTDTAENTTAALRPVSRTVVPSIASFTATPRTNFLIGSDQYEVETAGQHWSLSSPDDRTLRFEMRPGDRAWFDTGSVDRSQVERLSRIPAGTAIDIAYEFMLEPGAASTSPWFVTAELHNEDSEAGVPTSPPVAIELAGEHLRVVARYCPTGLNPSNRAGNLKMLRLWTDPNAIQRGRYYDIKIRANVDNTSKGRLDVWVSGIQVVNYHGPLGYGFATYWLEGLYRSADRSRTVVANFRDLMMTTGSTPR